MRVSVILPVYNGEKTLSRTLESLVNQNFRNFELVVCIDGTTDASKEIVQSYVTRFQSVVILENKKNMGLGPTMNRLVANAQGEYIAVAEQDDYYYPERLELQVEILEYKPEVGLVSGIADFWDGEKIMMQFPGLLVNGHQYPKGEEMFLLNYRNQVKVVNSALMFRKSIHVANGLYFSKHYPSVGIDWSYILRFSLVSEIYGIKSSLVLLDRRIGRNSVTTHKQKMFEASRELLRSFYYEYPHLISRADFKFAMTTQDLMELSNKGCKNFIIPFLKAFVRNPTDRRWMEYIEKRVARFFNKK